MYNKLKAIYFREQFYPNVLGIFFNPFYFSRKELNKSFKDLLPKLQGRILDVGCGTKPYEIFAIKSTEYIGLEVDSEESRRNKKADFFYDGKSMPFHDSSFDSVFSTQVLEHVVDPDGFIKEIKRVLKQDGVLLLSVPFIWDEHEQPYDFLRYTSFGIINLLKKNGFEIIEHRKNLADIRCLFQLCNTYFYKMTNVKNRPLQIIMTSVYSTIFNVLGLLLFKLFPVNEDFFLDNVVLAKRL